MNELNWIISMLNLIRVKKRNKTRINGNQLNKRWKKVKQRE